MKHLLASIVAAGSLAACGAPMGPAPAPLTCGTYPALVGADTLDPLAYQGAIDWAVSSLSSVPEFGQARVCDALAKVDTIQIHTNDLINGGFSLGVKGRSFRGLTVPLASDRTRYTVHLADGELFGSALAHELAHVTLAPEMDPDHTDWDARRISAAILYFTYHVQGTDQ